MNVSRGERTCRTNCELGIVFLVDRSASMGQNAGGSLTIMEEVQRAISTVVSSVLPDLWTVGLATFPDSAMPLSGHWRSSPTPIGNPS